MFKHTHIGAWRGETEIWGMNPAWARLTIFTTDAIPSFYFVKEQKLHCFAMLTHKSIICAISCV